VFNAARYVEAALTSICVQDYRRLEIIVIDDGSTDDSLARIERIARNDPRIKIISRPNRGLIASLNEGVALAQSDLIARMDADDIAYPTRISRQVETFEAAPGLALCATGIDVLDARRLWRAHQDPIFYEGDLRVLSLFFTVFIHPTVMYDRRVLGDLLHYDSHYPHAEDFDLFTRIIATSPVRLLRTPLLAYRMHNNRVSIRYRELQQDSHLRIVAKNLLADGFSLDVGALPAIAAEKNLDNALRAAAVLDQLDAQIAQRPEGQRPSYEAGAVRLVHFLMHVLLDASKAPLLCAMLARSGKWSTIRRRERLILRLASPIPQLASALMRQSDSLQRLVELPASRSADRLMAGLAQARA
jgi:cellulose synthase/poly-beta-1,6-N-acetylglucosamine synthase-like glycosyltransferase